MTFVIYLPIILPKYLCLRPPPAPLHLSLCLWRLAKTSYFWSSVSKPATGIKLNKYQVHRILQKLFVKFN